MSLQVLKQPLSVQWRYALVRLDRLVPRPALHLTSKPPYPIVIQLKSRSRHKIKLHVYIPPHHQHSTKGSFPVHLDFHGGNFFLGSCMEQAPFCSTLARETGKIVISIDYSMGPKSRFPAAIHDGEDVLSAVLKPSSSAGRALRAAIGHKIHRPTDETTDVLDTSRVSLSGFSSGGNLALNLVISTHDSDGDWPSLFPTQGTNSIPLLLFYPSFDQTYLEHERKPPEGAKPSRLKLSEVLGPTYLPKEERRSPRASPGLVDMKTGLHSRAKTFLVLPEIDSLAPQSEEWVKKMEREGRADDIQVEKCRGMKHGWTQIPDFVLDKEAKNEKYRMWDRAVEFLNRIEHTPVQSADDEKDDTMC